MSDHPLLGKTMQAFLVMLAIFAGPYCSPRLERYRVARAPWEKERSVTEVTSVATTPTALATGETSLKASGNEATVSNALPTAPEPPPPPVEIDPKIVPVEDPTGHMMDAFYEKLAQTERKEPGAVTRVLHYGDSVITSDYISGTMRRRMQARYGDAGHGFILVANPWEWYFHNDVLHFATEGWNANRITGPLTKDGAYGLGGVTFHGAPGASATFGTAERGEVGKRVGRFDVYYMEQPDGGNVEVRIGKGEPEKLSTRGDAKASRVRSFPVEDGEAKMVLRSLGGGDVRLFGVALERDVPGVTYDALGANGARIRLWEAMDADHWADQMALRKPALVVLQFGTNESEDGWFNAEVYEKSVRVVLSNVKRAAPDASILMAAPLDRAEKGDDGRLRSKKVILKLIASQRMVATELGVAYWDTWKAMGGEGAMGRWVNANPQLGAGDLTHPTPAGAQVIGEHLDKALAQGLAVWKARPRGDAGR